MKADRYLFDGSHPCALRKLPCDSKDDHVKKEDILAKTAEIGRASCRERV